MFQTRIPAFILVVLAAAAGARAAKVDEQRLIAILKSDAPNKDKAIPCKQLAIWGTEAAVPALAALLPDQELASWARIALEAIPGSASDDALREAMGKLEGRLLIGVINSIGVRRDAKAIGALVAKLKDPDVGVACAAAEALGRIGGAEAVKALEAVLTGAPPAVCSAAGIGCIYCAERFLAEGKADEATALYDRIRKTDLPKERVLEGTRGAVLVRGPAGVPLLLEQLRSKDKDFHNLGLRLARELPGAEATEALVAELKRLEPDRQAMLILALADRGDPKALPAVLGIAKSGPNDLRIVAMGALESLGDASCLPVLLAAALEADADIAKAAQAALAKLPGEDVDAAIAASLAEAEPKTRAILADLAGQRQIAAALPALVNSLGHADAAVRLPAIAAIGIIGGVEQVGDLVKAVQKAQDSKEQGAIEKALMAIAAKEGADSVTHLMPLTKSDKPALRIIGLHALATAGGSQALAAVRAAIDDKEGGVQDEAVRTLSTWPNKWPEDTEVVAPLMELAKSGKKPAHRILALRGYLQYVQGTKELSGKARLARIDAILPLVTRAEEKRLVVSALGSMGTPEALAKLVGFVADSEVTEEAASAIINLERRRMLRKVPKEQRQKALQTIVENSKSGRTRKRAADLLKGVR